MIHIQRISAMPRPQKSSLSSNLMGQGSSRYRTHMEMMNLMIWVQITHRILIVSQN